MSKAKEKIVSPVKRRTSTNPKEKFRNRMNMEFDDEMTAAIGFAGRSIKVEGQDFVRMAVKKLLRELADTGQVTLKVDLDTQKVCQKVAA